MSLINSIIELKDFRSLGKTLRNIGELGYSFTALTKNQKRFHQYWDGLPSNLRSLYHTFSGAEKGTPTLRQLFHSSADGYLQVQFNILPLLRDISAIANAAFKLEAAIRRLTNSAGRRQRRHYDFHWQEYESPATYVKTFTGSLSLGQFAGSTNPTGETGCSRAHAGFFQYTRRTSFPNATEFHAEIEYSYYFTQFQRKYTSLLALLDYLGVNLNPQIIWNAIPWTFVVDWVYSISKYLGEQKTLNMEPIVNVHRYLWSWTLHRKTSVWFRTTHSQNTGTQFNPTITDTYLPTLYEKAYRRDIGLPSTGSSLFGSGLSATELSLGVALATTAGRPPHTRLR
jgi:hypothetical protein